MFKMRLLVSTLALIAMASCAPTGIFHEGIYKLRDDGLYDLGNCSRDFVSCIDGSCDLMRCNHGSVFDASSGQCQQISDLPDCIEIEVIVVEEASAEEVSGASGADIVITESGEELIVESGASGETVFGSGETTEVHYSGESWESGASGESGEIDERSVESSGFSGEENSGLSGDGSGFSGAEESGFSGIESSGLSDIDGSGLSGEEESGLSGNESGFSGEVDASGITDNSGDVIELTDLGSGASGEMPNMVIIDQGSGQKIIIVEGVDSTWCANVPDGFYAMGCSSIVRACTFGVMETLECPDNMAFDPEKGVCDSPANVHLCTGQGIALDKPGESGDFSKLCIERGDGFFQKGCSASLIACSGGTETTLVCPSGLFFDEQKGFCVTRDSIPDCILEGSGDH